MAYILKQKGAQVQGILDAVQEKSVDMAGNIHLKDATPDESGLMSIDDKRKLDGISILTNDDIDEIWSKV